MDLFINYGLRTQGGEPPALYAFTSHTFTNATVTGRTGPTLAQCRAAYSSQSWAQNNAYFNMTNQGIQEWTVPATGTYRIEAAGAKGGGSIGGNGARMIGTFNLIEGNIIAIVVGQLGLTGTGNYSAGGGGVSAAWQKSNTNLLIAAGGGGGVTGGNFSSAPSLSHGQTSQNGSSGQSSPTWNNYPGGENGNGGGGSSGNGGAGSGGGWLSNANNDTSGSHGFGRPNGWLGGNTRTSASDRLSGSFGGSGGASGNPSSYKGGGGGGGYSGGGAAVGDGNNSSGAGGGGGSYNIGTNQSNTAGINTGHGYVTITKL